MSTTLEDVKDLPKVPNSCVGIQSVPKLKCLGEFQYGSAHEALGLASATKTSVTGKV